jgi:hypothetical protein
LPPPVVAASAAVDEQSVTDPDRPTDHRPTDRVADDEATDHRAAAV